jgi:hypothetical protein
MSSKQVMAMMTLFLTTGAASALAREPVLPIPLSKQKFCALLVEHAKARARQDLDTMTAEAARLPILKDFEEFRAAVTTPEIKDLWFDYKVKDLVYQVADAAPALGEYEFMRWKAGMEKRGRKITADEVRRRQAELDELRKHRDAREAEVENAGKQLAQATTGAVAAATAKGYQVWTGAEPFAFYTRDSRPGTATDVRIDADPFGGPSVVTILRGDLATSCRLDSLPLDITKCASGDSGMLASLERQELHKVPEDCRAGDVDENVAAQAADTANVKSVADSTAVTANVAAASDLTRSVK